MVFDKRERERLTSVFSALGFGKNVLNKDPKSGRFSLTKPALDFALKKAAEGNYDVVPTGQVFSGGKFKRANPKDKKVQKLLRKGYNLRKFEYEPQAKDYVSTELGRIRSTEMVIGFETKKDGKWKRFEVQYPYNGKKAVPKIGVNFEYTGKDWEKNALNDIYDDAIRHFGDSGVRITKAELLNPKIIQSKKSVPKSIGNIKLKNASFINLDGIEKQKFDTGQGMCVYDFISSYYRDDKKLIKEFLDEDIFDYIFPYDWRKEGLSVNAIYTWCQNAKVNMLALDKDQKLILKHNCEEGARKKTLAFIAHNEHLYGLSDKVQIVSVAQRFADRKVNNEIPREKKEPKEKKKEEEYKTKTVKLNGLGKSSLHYMIEYMEDHDCEIKNKNVKLGKDGVDSFICEKTNEKIIFVDPRFDALRRYMKAEGKAYDGKKPSSMIYEAMKDYAIPKSSPNPLIKELFNKEHIKDMVHRGWYNGEQDLDDPRLHTYDINKCHSSILDNPETKWYIIDFNSKIEDYKGGKIEDGFYFVETDDDKLFCGNKFYLDTTVRLGLKDGLITKDNIKKFISPAKKCSKTLFTDMMEQYQTKLNPKNPHYKDLVKLLNNSISGILGKTKVHRPQSYISTSEVETFSYLVQNAKENIFHHSLETDEREYHLYGNKCSVYLNKHNLFMYIQILCNQLNKLYKAIKSATNNNFNRLVYRNVDSFSIMDEPSNTDFIGNEIGQFSEDEPPEYIFRHPYKNVEVDWERYQTNWEWIEDIKTSNDYEVLFDFVEQKKSLSIQARAGFGKSYMIEKLVEKYGDEGVLRFARTNCAAVRIGGKTIHSTLNYSFKNGFGFVNEKVLKKFEKDDKIKVICLDEQGICDAQIWHLLYQLKNRVGCAFFSFGDFYQLGPIDGKMYMNNEIVKNICDNTVCNLEYHEKCRHDPEMFEVCESFREGSKDVSMFKTIHWNDIGNFDIHICYTNEMMNKINERCAELMFDKKEENKVDLTDFIEYYKLDIDLRSSYKICAGMPIIGIVNNYEKEYWNGERFRIMGLGRTTEEEIEDPQAQVDNFIMRIRSEIDNREIIINFTEYYKNFDLAFAMTNHKIIGATIASDFVIHETDFFYCDSRWLYTAVSRGKSIRQVHHLPSSGLPPEFPQASSEDKST